MLLSNRVGDRGGYAPSTVFRQKKDNLGAKGYRSDNRRVVSVWL